MNKILLAFLIVFLLTPATVLVYLSHDLTSPGRRNIKQYHKSWLETPKDHSVSVVKKWNKDETTPYLVVEPYSPPPSQRGQSLRRQLSSRRVILESFGTTEQHLLLLHGRGGRKEDMLPIAERYCAVGLRCIIPDLPAHGESKIKRMSFGTSLKEKAELLEILNTEEQLTQFKYKPSVWGISMGGSFASQLVGDHFDHFSSLLIINSFDSLENVVKNRLNKLSIGEGKLLYNITNSISKTSFGFNIENANSVRALKDSDLPVLVANGTIDELIPVQLGKNLYDALSHPQKRWIEVENANHDTILITKHELYADTALFMIENRILK